MSEAAKRPRRNWFRIGLFLVAAVVALALAWHYWLWQYFDRDLAGQAKRIIVKSNTPPTSKIGGWPQWRGPNRDGISTEKDFRTDWPEDGPGELLVWEQPIGSGYSSLAVADGRLFTMYGDGKKEAVVCLDAATGEKKWELIYRCMHGVDYGPGPRSTPTVDGDRLYTVGITGIMHCLQVSGPEPQILWERDLLRDFGAQNLRWGVSFSPLVVGDLVYVNPGESDGHSLVALDKITGQVRWHNLDDPGGYSSPVAAELAGKKQIVFFTGTAVTGVAPDTGEVYWRHEIINEHKVNAATPVVVGDRVFASSSYNAGCVLLKIERDNGGLKANVVYQNKKMQNHFSSSVHHEGHIYGFDNYVFKCLKLDDGKMTWNSRDFGRGSFLLADGHLVILSEEGYLALAEAKPDELKVKAGFQALTGRCWTMPVLADGRLYLRNEENILCLDLREAKD
jgi:outer membrane protein assembly factor BamB